MRSLLVVLTVVAILGALFSGGCSVLVVGEYLWSGAPGGLSRAIAQMSAGAGHAAAAVLAASVWVLRAACMPPSARRRLIAVVVACMDVAMAVATLWWIRGDEGFPWDEWPWSLLAPVGAVALGVKGVLIGAILARGAASETTHAGEP